MTSFIRESDDPRHPARFQHLAERMFGICAQRGWKHDDVPDGNRLFRFWPWATERPPVEMAAGILETAGAEREGEVALVLLGVRWRVPEPLVGRSLRDILAACARYGVCVTVGEMIPEPQRPVASVDVVLTIAITQRSLSAASVDDALKLLAAAQFELTEFCRRVVC